MLMQVIQSSYWNVVKGETYIVASNFWMLTNSLHFPSGSVSFLSAIKKEAGDFPGGAVVKNLPANAGDTGSSPGPGRSHMPRSN